MDKPTKSSAKNNTYKLQNPPAKIPPERIFGGKMQSLSFKVVANFSAVKNRPGSTRLGLRLADVDKKQWLNCRDNLKRCRVVACTSEGSNSGASDSPIPGSTQSQNRSSFLSRSQTYALLKQQLEVASKSEDYEEAARLRDSLKSFEDEEPVLRLKRRLKEAIDDERFEDAARYRDELKEVAPHSLLKCTSDATTLGIRVQVRSVYIEGRSQPSKGLYLFAYRIRITNNSDRIVQLLRRHWIITDANGKTENVWGVGVIGEQPVILPNTGFEYSSACPLGTSSGRMEGDFEMKHVDSLGSRTFNVAIAPFSLSTFGDGTDNLSDQEVWKL